MRARELETVAQVSAAATTVLDVDRLLHQVAHLTQKSFGLYHAQVYLLEGDHLALAAGAGEPGRLMKEQQHQIALNHEHSLVARAARSRQAVISNDVASEPDFLPNPLLPHTRSEMSIPMLVGDTLVGVLDVQADDMNYFTDHDTRVMGTLADQVAVAVQNARAYEQTQKALEALRENQSQLAEAHRIAQLGRWMWNPLTNEVAWNDQLYELYGVSNDTPASFDLYMRLIHPEDTPKVMASLQEALQSGDDTITSEYRIVRSGGEVRYNSVIGRIRRSQDGAPVEVVGIVQDITERKQSEAALAAERNLLRTLIDNLPDYVYVRDRQNRFLIANQSLARAIGVDTPEALVGKTDFDFFPHELAAGYHADDMAVMESGQPLKNREETAVDSEGNVQWLLTTKVPFRNQQGEVIGLIGNGRDITERRRSEHERQVLFDAANRFNNARTTDELLDAVTGYAVERGMSRASLLYIDNNRQGEPEWAEVVSSWSADGASGSPVGTRYHLSDFPFAALLLSNPLNPTLVDDSEASGVMDETTRALMQRLGIRGLVLLPLYTQGRWIGMISLSWSEPTDFTDQDQRIYTQFTRQATVKADAFRSAEATQRAREEAEILYRVSRNLTYARTLDEVLEATVRYARRKNLYSASLLFIDSDGEGKPEWAEIVSTWVTDGGVTAPVGTRFYLPEFPFARLWTANPQEPTLLGDSMNAPEMDEGTRELFRQFNLAGIALLPLYRQDRWVGLLTFSWDKPTTFTEQDERVFRSMARQATSVVEAMRAAALTQKRAIELATVAQVSTAATTILNVEELLQQVSDLTRASFDLYHVHVYLLDDAGDRLVLAAGAGEVGRIMKEQGRSIPLNRANSLVARAARERRGVIVNDVTQDPDFLPNPMLPDTKAEMAIPLLVGDELVGVLDVQASVTNRFTDEDVRTKSTLAAQVAVAVRNARAFERERQTAERLREVDRLKSQFLANMSHELRTPLNSIIGYSEVLLDGGDGDLGEEAVEDIQTIHGSGQHLLSIINDILDLAKIEAGQMQINPQAADLVRFLQEVVHAGQVLVKDKPVTLELVADSDVPQVCADPIRLRQIVWNLVSNAVKFTEQGSVTVSVGLMDDQAYVRVTDTGIGIQPEHVGLVFEQFSQVDGSSTRRAGGTGLGLTITRHLVRMHGGEIYVESEFGVGSTFWFTLPLYTPEKA